MAITPEQMRADKRYPNNFAFDFIRQSGVASTRAEAFEFVKKAADRLGVPFKTLIIIIADQYVESFVGVITAAEVRKAYMDNIVNMYKDNEYGEKSDTQGS